MKRIILLSLIILVAVSIFSVSMVYSECKAPPNCRWNSYGPKAGGGFNTPEYYPPGEYMIYGGPAGKYGTPPPKVCKASGPFKLDAGYSYVLRVDTGNVISLSKYRSLEAPYKNDIGILVPTDIARNEFYAVCLFRIR